MHSAVSTHIVVTRLHKIPQSGARCLGEAETKKAHLMSPHAIQQAGNYSCKLCFWSRPDAQHAFSYMGTSAQVTRHRFFLRDHIFQEAPHHKIVFQCWAIMLHPSVLKKGKPHAGVWNAEQAARPTEERTDGAGLLVAEAAKGANHRLHSQASRLLSLLFTEDLLHPSRFSAGQVIGLNLGHITPVMLDPEH